MSGREPYSAVEYRRAVKAEDRAFLRMTGRFAHLGREIPGWIVDLLCDRYDNRLRILSLHDLMVTRDTRGAPERESDLMASLPSAQRRALSRLYRAAVAYGRALGACIAATGIDGELAGARTGRPR